MMKNSKSMCITSARKDSNAQENHEPKCCPQGVKHHKLPKFYFTQGKIKNRENTCSIQKFYEQECHVGPLTNLCIQQYNEAFMFLFVSLKKWSVHEPSPKRKPETVRKNGTKKGDPKYNSDTPPPLSREKSSGQNYGFPKQKCSGKECGEVILHEKLRDKFKHERKIQFFVFLNKETVEFLCALVHWRRTVCLWDRLDAKSILRDASHTNYSLQVV